MNRLIKTRKDDTFIKHVHCEFINCFVEGKQQAIPSTITKTYVFEDNPNDLGSRFHIESLLDSLQIFKKYYPLKYKYEFDITKKTFNISMQPVVGEHFTFEYEKFFELYKEFLLKSHDCRILDNGFVSCVDFTTDKNFKYGNIQYYKNQLICVDESKLVSHKSKTRAKTVAFLNPLRYFGSGPMADTLNNLDLNKITKDLLELVNEIYD